MVDFAATAEIGGNVAAGEWASAAQGGAMMAAQAIGETDMGEWAADTGKKVAAAAAIGASAGLVCGPFAPICSAIGAIAGAFIALGESIAELFKDEPGTTPCMVDDLGGQVLRPCYIAAKMVGRNQAAWTVEPNSFERSLVFPVGKNKISQGKIFWMLRRIREDGLGIQHIWRLQIAMGLTPTLTGLPMAAELDTYAASIPIPKLGTPEVRAFVAGYAARIKAGASMPQAYSSLGKKPPKGAMLRYARTVAMLDKEFNGIPLPSQPGFTGIKSDGKPGNRPPLWQFAAGFGILYLAFKLFAKG